MRARRTSFVLTTLLLGSTALSAASRPPHNLHKVGDHWTAWEPPAAAEGQQIYIIVRGDTLWGLAKRFYGDPYLWPQLWEKNKYILDAHWIYPGDPLATGLEVAPVQSLAAAEPATTATPPGTKEPLPPPEVGGVESAAGAAGAPIPLGSESDIYCSGYIGDPEESLPYSVTGSEYDVLSPSLLSNYTSVQKEAEIQGVFGPARTVKYDLTTGDVVYVNAGQAQGLTPGKLFYIVTLGRDIRHPVRGGIVGRFHQYLGRLRILSVQDNSSIAEIVHSCDAIHIGAMLRPYEPEPVPLARPTGMRPVNYPAPESKLEQGPAIIYAQDNIISLGQDHFVFIDRGSDQDVTPGDIFTIYRMNRHGNPPVVLGELAVLSVQKKTALAKIIQSRYPIYLGDRLDPK